MSSVDGYIGRQTASHPDRIDGDSLSRILEQERLHAVNDLAVKQPSEGALGWVTDNVAAPAVNILGIQPYNALGNVFNPVTRAAFDFDVMPKAGLMHMPHAEYMSPAWFAQNISGGVSMALVFGGAAKGFGASIKGAARLTGQEGTKAAQWLARPTNALIAGGTLYEGLRDPHEGETRYGNMLGAAAGLTVFGLGHRWSEKMTGTAFFGTRFGTGAIGTSLQNFIATAASTGEGRSLEDVTKDAFSGGVMNLILPPLLGFKGLPRRMVNSESKLVEGEANGRPAPPDTRAPGPADTPERLPLVRPPVERPPGEKAPPGEKPPQAANETMFALPEYAIKPVALSHRGRGYLEYMLGDNAAGPFKSYSDFLSRGQVHQRTVFDAYHMKGNAQTEILYPSTRPGYNRITVEGLTEALHTVPDLRPIKRVSVFDGAHPNEPWRRQEFNQPKARVEGEATEHGEIKLYMPEKGNELATTIKHEWSHLHKLSDPAAGKVFDSVGNIEPLNVSGRSVHTGQAESWPRLAEGLMSEHPLIVTATAQANPVRTAVWGKSLSERLKTLPESQRTQSYEYYRQLADYIERVIKPRALEALEQHRQSGSADAQVRAREILEYLR